LSAAHWMQCRFNNLGKPMFACSEWVAILERLTSSVWHQSRDQAFLPYFPPTREEGDVRTWPHSLNMF
jgi:hypothetical protein